MNENDQITEPSHPSTTPPETGLEPMRVSNAIEVLSMLAIGEVDKHRVADLLHPGPDEFGELERLLGRLAVDLSEVLTANDAYVEELERGAVELRDRIETIESQQRAISELSTPVIEIWEDILTLPIIGVVDTRRSVEMTEKLLRAIVDHQARQVIIDVTGVEMVDTMTADHFVKMIRAAEMLGARCVVSGINPEVAQTLARLGVELGGVRTLRSLKDALRVCLQGESDRRGSSLSDNVRAEVSP